jgi:SAM-dependent methyltransferase
MEIEQFLSDKLGSAANQLKVLDVGCGRQPFRNLIERYGCHYVSLDVRQNPEGNVDYICAIDEQIPHNLLGGEKFDVILCTEVLEHVADWHQAFSNLANLCQRGGVVFVTCPHFYQLHEEPYDFWRPTPHAIAYYATKCGFTPVSLRKLGDTWDVLGTLVANIRFCPNQCSISAKLWARVLSRASRLLFALLRRKVVIRSVAIDSPIFLSNIAILQRD